MGARDYAYPIQWRPLNALTQFTVDVAYGETGLGGTWKGPAATVQAAQVNALRDVPAVIRATAQLAGKTLAAAPAFVRMASERLGDTDEFRLVVPNTPVTDLLDAASSRHQDIRSRADEAAAGLLVLAACLGESTGPGTIHLSYGRLNEKGSDLNPPLLLDAHVLLKDASSDVLLIATTWPETFGAALAAASVAHLVGAGRPEEGQFRYDLAPSATLRARERFEMRATAPAQAGPAARLLRECGLADEAGAFLKTFAFGLGE